MRVMLDMNRGTLEFALNGTPLGLALPPGELCGLKLFPIFSLYNKGDSLTILPSRYSSTTSGGDITARRLIRDASQVLSVLEDEEKSMSIARSTFDLWKRKDMLCLSLVNENEQPRGLLLDTSRRSIVLCGGLSWLRRGSAVYVFEFDNIKCKLITHIIHIQVLTERWTSRSSRNVRWSLVVARFTIGNIDSILEGISRSVQRLG